MNLNKFNLLFSNKDKTVPIWLMRQAGRYLEDYRKIRSNFTNFLDFCYNPTSACEVTLQPIQKFDFDAAIIFSDILVIPDSLGQKVEFVKNEGPKLDIFDFKYIDSPTNLTKLSKVYQAIELTRQKLDPHKSLIGFAGAPFTLACYMTDTNKSKDYQDTKSLMYGDYENFKKIIERLTTEVTNHLSRQIEAGCDIVKIFDSWAGILHENFYHEMVIEPNRQIVQNIRNKYPHVKIICFPRNSSINYLKFISQVKPDVIAIDQYISKDWVIENFDKDIIIQGNLDPALLTVESKFLESEIINILEKFKKRRLIFNLGHGITPQAKVENVKKLISIIREFENE